jgi:quercetin dioxygenase-like cupin family protein
MNESGEYTHILSPEKEVVMPFFSFNDSRYKEVAPGVRMRSAHLSNTMLTYFELEPGACMPSHKHPHEQVTLVIEGEMELTVGDETHILKCGEGATVPPNVEHKAVILSQLVKAVDAWYPIREDYVIE